MRGARSDPAPAPAGPLAWGLRVGLAVGVLGGCGLAATEEPLWAWKPPAEPELAVDPWIESSWRWLVARTEAQGAGGSAAEGDYEFPHGWFATAGLTAHLRPWRLELSGETNPHASRPSYRAAFRAAFVGWDSTWWDLRPYLAVSGARHQLDLELAGTERAADWRTWRFEGGLAGFGAELAGAETYLSLQHDRLPAVIGFEDQRDGSVLALVDEDLRTTQLGIGFRYDWGDQVAATRRRYTGFFAAIGGEMALLWLDTSSAVRAQARSRTGTSRIDEPLYYDFAGEVELGFLCHRLDRDHGAHGWWLRAGYRADLRLIGVDEHDHHHHDHDADELDVVWDRYRFEHGPFVRLAARF